VVIKSRVFVDIMCCMQSQVEDDEEDSQLMRLGKTVLTTNSSSMSLVVILSTLQLYKKIRFHVASVVVLFTVQ